MEINKDEIELTEVNLTEKTILEYLNSGLTWYKKDDVGYGSIEETYSANPSQIASIRKHPSFKGVKTKVTIFNIIKDDNSTSPEPRTLGTTSKVEQPMVSVDDNHKGVDVNTTEAADIFANL